MIDDPETVKILATVGPDGVPDAVVKSSLRLRDDGLLEYDELLETSLTGRNMIYALWFDRTVSVNLVAPGGRGSLGLLAKPVRVAVSGREYKRRYQELRLTDPDSDLGAVWTLALMGLTSKSLKSRRREEEKAHPLLRHLDRLTVDLEGKAGE
jgi:hypothetical protein